MRESGFKNKEDEKGYKGFSPYPQRVLRVKNVREKSEARTWRNGVRWVREVGTQVVLVLIDVRGSHPAIEGIGAMPAAADKILSSKVGVHIFRSHE